MAGETTDDVTEQKEQHRLGTINQWDAPEADWAAEYDWTRYRGPPAYPVPGGWVLGHVEADGTGWFYFGQYGHGSATDDTVMDALEAADGVEDPYETLEEAREARASLLNEIADGDDSSLREEPDMEWSLTIDGTEVFRRVEPEREDLYATVAEALQAYEDDELGERAESITPTTGRKPADVREQEQLERREAENESLDEFVTDGGQRVDETECVVCGQSERPDKGWIYKSGDVKPVEIEDGELRWEAKDGADAYCSTECSRNADTGGSGGEDGAE